MAGADDDIEKLLREVDGVLGGGGSRSAAQPQRARGEVQRSDATGFLQAAVPRATTIGAAWGVGVGGAFLVLPFLSSISGAVAAFVTGFSVSILGRWRRR